MSLTVSRGKNQVLRLSISRVIEILWLLFYHWLLSRSGDKIPKVRNFGNHSVFGEIKIYLVILFCKILLYPLISTILHFFAFRLASVSDVYFFRSSSNYLNPYPLRHEYVYLSDKIFWSPYIFQTDILFALGDQLSSFSCTPFLARPANFAISPLLCNRYPIETIDVNMDELLEPVFSVRHSCHFDCFPLNFFTSYIFQGCRSFIAFCPAGRLLNFFRVIDLLTAGTSKINY